MKQKFCIGVLITGLFLALACRKDGPIAEAGDGLPVQWDTTPYLLGLGTFPDPMLRADNRLTIEKVKLGRMLFYEKRLSKDNSISCGSCHMQKFAFTDTARFSLGVLKLKGKRQSMAAFNMAWNNDGFFWDGRAQLLRDQALKPIQDTLEMHETLHNVEHKLEDLKSYRDQFHRAFGNSVITSQRIALALEQFMITIISNRSKYDRYLAKELLLSPEEERGRKLFFAEYNKYYPEVSGAECSHCHSGINFENDQYMNNGLDGDADIKDPGRQAVTGLNTDRGKFKVPSLRNIQITAPYMHDGRFRTLEEVVEHYDHGLKPSSFIDPALENTRGTGLRLTAQQKSDLISFLKTLTDPALLTDPRFSDPQ